MDQVVPTAVICGIHSEMETLPGINFSSYAACVFQSFTRLIFSDLVGKHIGNDSMDTVEDESALTLEEQNAIRYVGGYIVRTLKAKTKDKQTLSCLQQLESSDQSDVENQVSAQWIVEINRGGLIHITDEAHDGFVASEAATRRHFKVSKAHTMDENTKKKVVGPNNSRY